MLESELENFRLASVFHAIAYFNHKNPARSKALNLFEPERFIGAVHHAESPNDIWACICLAITKTLKSVNDTEARFAFEKYYLGDPVNAWSKEEIAQLLETSVRQVNRKIRRIIDELEQELIRRNLLEPPQRPTGT